MKVRNLVLDNLVVIIFIAFTALGFIASGGAPIVFFLNELMERVFRNFFLVLSLIIPVVAGLGLNFGIVVGAMVGQLAIVFVRYHALLPTIQGLDPNPVFGGISGILICFLVAAPVSAFCGWLTGRLYNRVRGQETISSLIVGFFAQGIYLFILLFAVGIIIPVTSGHPLIKFDDIGVRMSVDLGFLNEGGMRFALDNIVRVPPMYFLLVAMIGALAYLVINKIRGNKKVSAKVITVRFIINLALCLTGLVISLVAIITDNTLMWLNGMPLVTALVMVTLCLFLHFLGKTKLGQDFRSVGQNQHIAEVSGINVDKTRIIATIFSTVLAAWGMIIFMQNMGTMATYDSFRNIGMFSVATILVGGASTSRASIKNAVIGALLFNSMTIISPELGRAVFGSPEAGEYFRSFVVYGCIGLALGIHVWKQHKEERDKLSL